jgi:hypothetical protein
MVADCLYQYERRRPTVEELNKLDIARAAV